MSVCLLQGDPNWLILAQHLDVQTSSNRWWNHHIQQQQKQCIFEYNTFCPEEDYTQICCKCIYIYIFCVYNYKIDVLFDLYWCVLCVSSCRLLLMILMGLLRAHWCEHYSGIKYATTAYHSNNFCSTLQLGSGIVNKLLLFRGPLAHNSAKGPPSLSTSWSACAAT